MASHCWGTLPLSNSGPRARTALRSRYATPIFTVVGVIPRPPPWATAAVAGAAAPVVPPAPVPAAPALPALPPPDGAATPPPTGLPPGTVGTVGFAPDCGCAP